MGGLEEGDMYYYPGIPSEGKWRDRKKKALVEVKTPPLAGIRHHGGNDKNFASALSFRVRDVDARGAKRVNNYNALVPPT
jgi:hypothetical protein